MSKDEEIYREKLAAMMIRVSIATGHGDTFDDLLGELERVLKDAKSLPTPKDYEG